MKLVKLTVSCSGRANPTFMVMLKDMKKDMASKLAAKQTATKEIMAQMMAELTKGQDKPLKEVTPEQIVLQAETYAELHDGLGQISARERTYLLYRYGFTNGDEHPIPETAAHFHLTEKWAKKTSGSRWIICGANCRIDAAPFLHRLSWCGKVAVLPSIPFFTLRKWEQLYGSASADP